MYFEILNEFSKWIFIMFMNAQVADILFQCIIYCIAVDDIMCTTKCNETVTFQLLMTKK